MINVSGRFFCGKFFYFLFSFFELVFDLHRKLAGDRIQRKFLLLIHFFLVVRLFGLHINIIVRFIHYSLILFEFLIFLVFVSSMNNESRILLLIPKFLFTDWVKVADVIRFQYFMSVAFLHGVRISIFLLKS